MYRLHNTTFWTFQAGLAHHSYVLGTPYFTVQFHAKCGQVLISSSDGIYGCSTFIFLQDGVASPGFTNVGSIQIHNMAFVNAKTKGPVKMAKQLALMVFSSKR